MGEGKIDDPDDSASDETGQHWQIVTAKPGGKAGANVGNAYSIKKWFIKIAKQDPANYISIPN